ncbi:transposase [Cucumis melo var. makuwa]|uniref:Transposase n=1 Tax=Cucumis melo var. makuwa TaxID=1194695 RepID=A0A5A7SKF0_CUCMM|nr:transposase [Cucumis melo var. makuwa]
MVVYEKKVHDAINANLRAKTLGDDIGTYLAPLIEDLKILWENGVECYDAYREEVFNLRSVLLWTINDFPANGNLSGCYVKGYKACPICGDNTNSIRLRHGKKIAYLGHQKFLARDHPYQRQKKSFNGKKKLGTIPEPLSGEDVYLKLKDLEFPKGKKIHKNLSMNRSENICWNRLSSFFELSYWKDLHVRNCLDVMHIEKNVCMNILGTLLDIPGKSEDGLNARRDLVDLKLRPDLAPISSEKKIFILPACYTLTKEEKRCVLKTLSRIKVPEDSLKLVYIIVYTRELFKANNVRGIEKKGKRKEVESLDKPKENEKKGKEGLKMNEPELDVLKERDLIKMPTEKEVVSESTSTLPLAMKSIPRYAEKVMEKDSSITFSLPVDLFGISRKSSVLREDIIDICNMNEVKMFTLVAYMISDPNLFWKYTRISNLKLV